MSELNRFDQEHASNWQNSVKRKLQKLREALRVTNPDFDQIEPNMKLEGQMNIEPDAFFYRTPHVSPLNSVRLQRVVEINSTPVQKGKKLIIYQPGVVQIASGMDTTESWILLRAIYTATFSVPTRPGAQIVEDHTGNLFLPLNEPPQQSIIIKDTTLRKLENEEIFGKVVVIEE